MGVCLPLWYLYFHAMLIPARSVVHRSAALPCAALHRFPRETRFPGKTIVPFDVATSLLFALVYTAVIGVWRSCTRCFFFPCASCALERFLRHVGFVPVAHPAEHRLLCRKTRRGRRERRRKMTRPRTTCARCDMEYSSRLFDARRGTYMPLCSTKSRGWAGGDRC